MTDAQVRWLGRVEETFNKLRWADRDAQELACKSIQEKFGSEEAGAKLRELFKADKAKLADRAAEIAAKIEKAEREAKASAVRIEEPKVEVVKPKPVVVKREVVGWKQTSNGAWEYLLEGETQYRRHFGPPPKHLVDKSEGEKAGKGVVVALKPQQQEKPEPEIEEPEPEQKVEPEAKLPAVMPSAVPAPAWDQAIAAMNRQHAIIENVGGKAVIASWEPSTIDPSRLVVVFQNKESFLLRYSNRLVSIEVHDGKGGTVRVPLGKWWLGHRDRQQYRGVTFRPGGEKTVSELLNLWQGWGVEAKAGDWGLIDEHILEVIAGGNKEFGDYVKRWIAWAIQNPAAQAEVALVLIGPRGIGKGTLVRCLQRIFGAHAFQVTTREEVIGKFNGHLQDCVLFVADEAYWGGDKRCVGRLQGMITEPTLPIERKGIDLIQVPNYLHVVMLAEPGWVIPAGRYERRYAALDVSAIKRTDKEYFRALHNQIKEGGAEAMFYDLGKLDLGDWHPRDIPDALLTNPALRRQQGFTLPPLEQWFVMLLHEGMLPRALPTRPNTALTRNLLDDAKERIPRLRWDLTEVGLWNFLTDEETIGLPCTKYRANFANGWSFAPLDELREAWVRRYGPVKWHTEGKEWGKKGRM